VAVKRSFLADIFGVLSTNIYILGIGVIIGIILPRMLGPEQSGVYFAILAVPALLFRLLEMGIRASTVFHSGRKLFNDQEILTGVIFIFLLSSLLCIIILLLTFYFVNDPSFTFPLVLLVMLLTPLQLMAAYSKGLLIARERIRAFNRVNGAVITLNLIGVLIFVVILKWSVFGSLLALLCSNFVLGIVALKLVFSGYSFQLKFNSKVIGSLYRHGLLFALSFFIMRLNYRVDILILQQLSTHSEIGYYSLGVNIAQLLWEIPAAIGLIIATRTAHSEDISLINKQVSSLFRIALLISFVSAVVIYFLTPIFTPLIWGEKFIPSISMTQTILPGTIFITLFLVLNSYFVGNGKPKFAIYIFTPALLINVVLNYLWIPSYGGVGAAMATNVSYILGTIAMIIVFSVDTKTSLIEMFKYRKSDFDFLKKIKDRFFGKRIKNKE
jgi:O-antigen/teichoic acid export membrane protein